MELGLVIRELSAGELVKPGERILIALSGGADSVALAAILSECAKAAGFFVEAAHFHHGIRAESDSELEFVQRLCARLDMPCHCERGDVPGYARANKLGLEAAARKLRYEFLSRTAASIGASRIALAHHRRDQAETVLMHLLRGSSIQGLCGMRSSNGPIFRPLLDVDPAELRSYLAERGIAFCEDASNADVRYTRNYIRHRVLPVCRDAYPGCERSLAKLARSAQLEDDFMRELTAQALERCLQRYPGGIYLKRVEFGALHTALQLRIAAHIMRQCFNIDPEQAAMERILSAFSGQYGTLAAGIDISGSHSRVYIGQSHALNPLAQAAIPLSAAVPAALDTPWGVLRITPGTHSDCGDGHTRQAVDMDALAGAVLRVRRGGETILPLGAPGSKKLKDYWIDKGVDRQLRPYMPVIACGSEVLWSPGVGIAQSVAVSSQTRSIAMLELSEFSLWPA